MTIQQRLLEARKAKDKVAISTLALVSGELARQPSKEYTNEQMYSVVRKLIKSITDYPGEFAARELEVLNSLLPKQISDDDIRSIRDASNSIQTFMDALPEGTDKKHAATIWREDKQKKMSR